MAQSKHDQSEIIKCPRCGEVMIYKKDFEYWKCPRCDGEFWPEVDFKAELPPVLVDKQIRECYREMTSFSFVQLPKKRSSNKSGRRFKKRKKRANWQNRYVFV